MAIDQVLVNFASGETRVALMEDGRLRELMVARPDMGTIAGDIFLGRVERVLPGIQAAFVDIGTARSGFLALADVRPAGLSGGAAGPDIGDFVNEGDRVRVQAANDPAGDKGARLTTHITLSGRYLVATPDQAGIRVSRRLGEGEERRRLLGLMEELAGDGEGFILRTASVAAGRDALMRDIDYLRAVWAEVTAKQAAARKAPLPLYRELDPLRRILRDQSADGLRRIIIDDGETLAAARAFCERLVPDMKALLEPYRGKQALFDAYAVEEQIDAALDPVVGLPSGGSIVIEATRALTAIDVNTGGHTEGTPEETALATNLEAVPEIARQLRLRDLSGLIAVDFVSMRRRDGAARVLAAMRRAVADDACPTHVAGLTRLGLIEMTRQRRHASLADIVMTSCPACSATGHVKSPETVAFEALRRVLREAAAAPAAGLTVTAAPAVIEALRGPAKAALGDVEKRLGRALRLAASDILAPDQVDVAAGGEANDG